MSQLQWRDNEAQRRKGRNLLFSALQRHSVTALNLWKLPAIGVYCLMTILLSHSQIFGDIHLAESYFDAGDYTHAYTEYQGAFDDSMSAWQQAILLYDMGTALLAQGKWEEALTHFDHAAAQSEELPLLNQRMGSNRALANLMLFKERREGAETQATLEMLVFFRREMVNIDAALAAWCALFAAEGAKNCPQSIVLEEIRAEAKRLYTGFLEEYENYWLKQASMKKNEGTPWNQAVQRLLISYSLAIVKDPIQEIALQQLIKTQTDLKELVEAQFKEAYF